jgi:hypothetical protein
MRSFVTEIFKRKEIQAPRKSEFQGILYFVFGAKIQLFMTML